MPRYLYKHEALYLLFPCRAGKLDQFETIVKGYFPASAVQRTFSSMQATPTPGTNQTALPVFWSAKVVALMPGSTHLREPRPGGNLPARLPDGRRPPSPIRSIPWAPPSQAQTKTY
jgi:hypothetical protein